MPTPVDRDAALAELDRILASPQFQRAERSSALLRFVVEQAVAGQAERLKEYTLGAEALGRGPAFDPRTDTVVRAEATRLRARLDRYFRDDGRGDPVLVELPRGSYVPLIRWRTDIADRDTAATVPAPVDEPPSRRPVRARATVMVLLAVVGAALTAAVTVTRWWGESGQAPPPPMQFDVELRSGGTLGSQVGTDVVLTPDGQRLVFVARDDDGLAHIHTRRLDDAAIRRLPGTGGARSVFTDPDGRWVGFWAGGRVQKVPVEGGSPVTICDAPDLLGASWGPNGRIVAALDSSARLWTCPDTGGQPEVLVDLSPAPVTPLWPQWLPGGDAVIYTVLAGDADNATIEAFSTADGRRHVLVRGGTFGRLLGDSHLAFVNQGTVYAQRFDADDLAVSGSPAPLLDEVSYSRTFGYAQFALSSNGTAVFRRGSEGRPVVVEWIGRGGTRTPLLRVPGRYNWPRISWDGRRLALSATEAGQPVILVHDLTSGETTRHATGRTDHAGLMWWPGDRFLLFGGVGGMSVLAVDGTTPARLLDDRRALAVPWSSLPDGSRLVYAEMAPGTAFDIMTAPMITGEDGLRRGSPVPFLATRAMETTPVLSPDGRWLAYASNVSGVPEIYVQAFPGGGAAIRVSSGGGTTPRWSVTGRELLYRTVDRRVVVVTCRVTDGRLEASPPVAWAPDVLADTGVLPSFDLAPDGERIAALVPAPDDAGVASPNHVTIALGFTAEPVRR